MGMMAAPNGAGSGRIDWQGFEPSQAISARDKELYAPHHYLEDISLFEAVCFLSALTSGQRNSFEIIHLIQSLEDTKAIAHILSHPTFQIHPYEQDLGEMLREHAIFLKHKEFCDLLAADFHTQEKMRQLQNRCNGRQIRLQAETEPEPDAWEDDFDREEFLLNKDRRY